MANNHEFVQRLEPDQDGIYADEKPENLQIGYGIPLTNANRFPLSLEDEIGEIIVAQGDRTDDQGRVGR